MVEKQDARREPGRRRTKRAKSSGTTPRPDATSTATPDEKRALDDLLISLTEHGTPAATMIRSLTSIIHQIGTTLDAEQLQAELRSYAAFKRLSGSSDYQELAGERSQQAKANLLQAMVVSDPAAVAPESLAQATREAARRNGLLATPTYSYEALQQLRGDASAAATRTAVSRLVRQRRLFTVPTPGGRVVIPAILLTDEGAPRDDLGPLLQPLMDANMGPWQLWTWLVSPTPLLSGGVPVELAANPATAERAASAAMRMAARITPAHLVVP